jgi:type 1 glutamine amidotransferase
MHYHAVIAAMAIAFGLCNACIHAAEPKPLKALLVTGGCCHDYASQKLILTEGITARANVEWTIVHEGGTSTDHRVSIYEKPDWGKDYDVVVHNECFAKVTDPAFVENVAAAHRNGLPCLVIHCTMHTFRDLQEDTWRELLGVTTRRHERQHPLEIRNLKPDDAVMYGFPETWKTGDEELYVIEKLWPNTVPLAQGYGVDTKADHVVIWKNTYGKGRVFGTTLVHHSHHMREPVYLDLVTRGLLWACDKLDSSGKPVEGYGPKK